jgi:signal transduction histidine kinase
MTSPLPPNDYTRQLEILRQVDLELSRRLNIDYVLVLALDAAVRLSVADAGAIHLLENGQLRIAHVIGAFPAHLLNTTMPVSEGLVGRVFRTKKAEMVLDVQADPDYKPTLPQTKAQITIPLVAEGEMVGVLNVQTNKPERFSPSVFQFVQMLAARAALAIVNAQLYRQMQHQLVELQELYRRVSELEKLKSDMIRMASHDLRNPLTNVMAAVELLRADISPEIFDHKRDVFDIIQQSISRMRNITTDILSVERIEQMTLGEGKVLDLYTTLQRVYLEYEAQAAQKSLNFTWEASEDPVFVSGDEAQLYEVATNLVNNAIKYTPEGGDVRLVLRIDEDTDKAVFEVVDTGYGIPESQQENLFRPFYRATTKETRSIEGTGLGLHLVKSIVERHGGKTRFHSVYKQGSTFGFELPIAWLSDAQNGQ